MKICFFRVAAPGVMALTLVVIFVSSLLEASGQTSKSSAILFTDSSAIINFEKKIASWKERRHIPSLSMGIVHAKTLIYKKGLGYSDVENKIEPDEHTIYHLASITKTFGSLLLMQQVELGKISLDDPINKYKINLGARWQSDERIKLKHLVTHTAQGNSLNIFKPGYSFKYNGDFFGRIEKPIEQVSGQSFESLLFSKVIQPLDMTDTAPTPDQPEAFAVTGYDATAYRKNIAKPYAWKKGKLVSVKYRGDYFGPAAGLLSSVNDMAKYSIAIDERRFLKSETWDLILTPAQSENGKTLPYGLGWFIRYYQGVKVMWHTGLWDGCSALFVKIPEKDLAFILLANSPGLSNASVINYFNPFKRKLSKNLKASPFGRAFLKEFTNL